MIFTEWLKKTTSLSESSIEKYSRAIGTVSTEMMAEKSISKPISEMELYELDLAIAIIFRTPYFVSKDERGNHMYSSALKWYRCFIESFSEKEEEAKKEENKILTDSGIPITERQAIVKSRIGQGQFRDNLILKYKGCIITGIDIPQVLVASHIKPWAVSDNKERLDVDNGLLLSATYDRLFDSGLIAFNEKGQVLASKFISADNLRLLGIDLKNEYPIKYSSRMENYLTYHRDVVYLK